MHFNVFNSGPTIVTSTALESSYSSQDHVVRLGRRAEHVLQRTLLKSNLDMHINQIGDVNLPGHSWWLLDLKVIITLLQN